MLMELNMELFIITLILIALAFAGIAIKIWAKKGGEFAVRFGRARS
jgi:hypothetical protein